MATIQPIKPLDMPSMHEELQARLKEYILVNKLQPDDPIPTEAQLAEQLGVSRAAVREGLRSLESLGMIYTRRGEGRYVRSFNMDAILQNLQYSMLFDTEDLRQMIEVRARLEEGFITDAIGVMDEATLQELRGLVDQMQEHASRNETFLEQDLLFHATIYRPLHNQVLSKLLSIFCVIYKNLRDAAVRASLTPTVELAIHEEIFDAIEARDSELARSLIVQHFESIKRRVHIIQAISPEAGT